jgi:hypothetical protein
MSVITLKVPPVTPNAHTHTTICHPLTQLQIIFWTQFEHTQHIFVEVFNKLIVSIFLVLGTRKISNEVKWRMYDGYSNNSFIQSFYCHVQNVMISCCSPQFFPFLSVMYFSLPPCSTHHTYILHHFNLPSISWSTSQSCCFQIHIQYSFGILFPSILCTCPN